MNILTSSLYHVVHFTPSYPTQTLPNFVKSVRRLARRKIVFVFVYVFSKRFDQT